MIPSLFVCSEREYSSIGVEKPYGSLRSENMGSVTVMDDEKVNGSSTVGREYIIYDTTLKSKSLSC
jgi:hypothetical protein